MKKSIKDSAAVNVARRKFIISSAAAGGGLALGMHVPFGIGEAAAQAAAAGTELNVWVVVNPDETCVVRIARGEMGQGTRTGHAVIIADELGVDLERVTVVTAEPADPFRRNGQMGSGGSWGGRAWYQPLRKAAAQAREVLVAAAAAQRTVPAAECRLERGELVHAASQRRQEDNPGLLQWIGNPEARGSVIDVADHVQKNDHGQTTKDGHHLPECGKCSLLLQAPHHVPACPTTQVGIQPGTQSAGTTSAIH